MTPQFPAISAVHSSDPCAAGSIFRADGLLREWPVGICPACGEAVYNHRESDGPVWVCRRDLHPDHPLWLPSAVSTTEMEQTGVYSLCYDAGAKPGYRCRDETDHLPLHGACYDAVRPY